jgi:hypothetical protein
VYSYEQKKKVSSASQANASNNVAAINTGRVQPA